MSLSEIKSHPRFPFRDFAENVEDARLLRKYWRELFRRALRQNTRGWVQMYPADLTDGNPILSFINRGARPYRALRVVQRFNHESLPELTLESNDIVYFEDDAYVPFAPMLNNEFLDIDGETSIEELVISSDISDKCEYYFRSIVREWCTMRIPLHLMEAHIGTYWDIVNSRLAPQPPEPEVPAPGRRF